MKRPPLHCPACGYILRSYGAMFCANGHTWFVEWREGLARLADAERVWLWDPCGNCEVARYLAEAPR